MKPTNNKLKKIIKEELTRTIREEQMIRAIVQEAIATGGNIDEGFMDTMKGAWGKVKSKAGDIKTAAKGMVDPEGASVERKKKIVAKMGEMEKLVDEFRSAAQDRSGEEADKLVMKYFRKHAGKEMSRASKGTHGSEIAAIINQKIVKLGHEIGPSAEGILTRLVNNPKKATKSMKSMAARLAEDYLELKKSAEKTLKRTQVGMDRLAAKGGMSPEMKAYEDEVRRGPQKQWRDERNDAERTKRWRREADASERKKSDWDSESTRRMMTRGG